MPRIILRAAGWLLALSVGVAAGFSISYASRCTAARHDAQTSAQPADSLDPARVTEAPGSAAAPVAARRQDAATSRAIEPAPPVESTTPEQAAALRPAESAEPPMLDAEPPTLGATLSPREEFTLARPLYFQVVNPADEARANAPRPGADSRPAAPAATGVPVAPAVHLRSFELPAVEVVGERPASDLKEEDRVGPNEQPRWTAARRFPGTRIYVLPPETVEFEFWLRPTSPRHGSTKLRSLFELELGLPNRFQLDLYFRTESETHGPTQVGESVELRYAFAEWNKIWGNPTLYAEWSRLEDEPDAVEFKLLLGGEIAPRWHWGVNLSDELQTGGERENEIEITGGISYTVIDSKLSIGLETECGVVDTHGHRGRFDDKFFFLGPSIQYRPTEQFHIDFAPLVGLTGDSPAFRAYLVVGYEF